MARYWIAVASKEHVQRGVRDGFAQVCHGKIGSLSKMSPNDWIIYYSPATTFGGKDPCQSFTAIGRIAPGEPYQFAMSHDFIPWRRNVTFLQSRDAAIKPLLDRLGFITDKKKWGFPFRRGHFEITEQDFEVIAKAMGILNE
jgi:hypothetical protein